MKVVVNVCIFIVIFSCGCSGLSRSWKLYSRISHPSSCALVAHGSRSYWSFSSNWEGMEGKEWRIGELWDPQGTGILSLFVYLWRNIGMVSRAEDMRGCSVVSSTVHKRAWIAQSSPAGYPSEFWKVQKTTTPVLSALFFRPRITKVHFKETQFELRVLGKDVSFRRHIALLWRAGLACSLVT